MKIFCVGILLTYSLLVTVLSYAQQDSDFKTVDGWIVGVPITVKGKNATGYRFVPDKDCNGQLRKLTTISYQAGQDWIEDIDLATYYGKKVSVKGNFRDDVWITSAEVKSK